MSRPVLQPPPIPPHLLMPVQAGSSGSGKQSPTSSSDCSLLPYAATTPSAPTIAQLSSIYPNLCAANGDPLYLSYNPYPEGIDDDSKYGDDDDDGVVMYEVELNATPRAPPPVPARPSWSPSVTAQLDSPSSASSSRASLAHHHAHRNSLSSSASSRYVHSSELSQPPTVLDPQQLQARVLTEKAERLWFRIHDTELRLSPVAFDDLNEMTNWVNRAKFCSDRIIRESHGRMLCSLRWLMSDAGQELFAGMKGMIVKAEQMRRQQAAMGGRTLQEGTWCDMEYFFYGDDIGILYTEWPAGKVRWHWKDEADRDSASGGSSGGCCVIA